MDSKRLLTAALMIAALAGSAWAGDAPDGQKVYAAKCAMCHAKDARGSAAMQKVFKLPEGSLDLLKIEALQKSTTEFTALVMNGHGKMPAFKDKMTAEETAAVEAYVHSLSKPAGADGAKKLYEAKCASCHGKDGKGNAAMAKAFKLEPAALSIVDDPALGKDDAKLAALTRDGKGKMPAYGAQLSGAEIDGIIEYLRSLLPKKDAEKQ